MPYYVDLVLRYNILFFLILDYSIIYNMTTDALHEIIYNAHTYTLYALRTKESSLQHYLRTTFVQEAKVQ